MFCKIIYMHIYYQMLSLTFDFDMVWPLLSGIERLGRVSFSGHVERLAWVSFLLVFSGFWDVADWLLGLWCIHESECWIKFWPASGWSVLVLLEDIAGESSCQRG